MESGAALCCAGIARTSRGYTVYLYSSATSSIIVREGLTLDGVWGYINADRSSKPVVYFIKHLDRIKVGVVSHVCEAARNWVGLECDHVGGLGAGGVHCT